jgi:hypothetical protein
MDVTTIPYSADCRNSEIGRPVQPNWDAQIISNDDKKQPTDVNPHYCAIFGEYSIATAMNTPDKCGHLLTTW